MNEARRAGNESRERPVDTGDRIAADLEALRHATRRDVPTVHAVIRAAARRPHEEGGLMALAEGMRRRPLWSALAAGALVVVALLAVPFSYDRVTGQRVALTLGGDVAPDRLRGIASEMRAALHGDGVRVEARPTNGAMSFELSSIVPAGSGVNAAAAAHGLAAELGRLGYQAQAEVTPVKERVTGSVYAYARDHVIRVNVDGKSAAQIEAEIRQGFADAGLTNAQVSVTEGQGGKELKVKVEARKEANDGQPEGPMQLELTRNGQSLEGKGLTIREERRRSPDGTTLTIIVGQNGKQATIEIPHADTMSDAAITETVRTQLQNAGIDAQVKVTNGHVEVMAK